MKAERMILRHLLAFLAAALLAACGADTKTGSNGTGNTPYAGPFLSAGTVVSIDPYRVEGGTSLQTGTAQFRVDEAADPGGAAIRLGMNLEAVGMATGLGSVDVSVAATQSAASGPVAALDAEGHRFTVASLAFVSDANTLYDGLAGFAALAPGMYVQVSGLPLADLHTLLATRITLMPAPADGRVSVAGRVEGFTAQGVSVAGLTIPPAPLGASLPSVGDRVRVTGAFDASTNAFSVEQAAILASYAPADGSVIEAEGIALDPSNGASSFRLRTPARDYLVTPAAGTAAQVAAGSRVRVLATAMAGTLVSASLTPVAGTISYAVSGTVSDFASLASLRVGGEPADLTMATIQGGSASDIANGRRLAIVGVAGPGALRVTQATLLP